jgi:hypothetical protein
MREADAGRQSSQSVPVIRLRVHALSGLVCVAVLLIAGCGGSRRDLVGASDDVSRYLLQGRELGDFVLAPRYYITNNPNPYVFGESEVAEMRVQRGAEGLVSATWVSYDPRQRTGRSREPYLIQKIFRFDTREHAWDFILRSQGNQPFLLFRNTLVVVGAEELATDAEKLAFTDCITRYRDRLHADAVVEGRVLNDEEFRAAAQAWH